MTRTDKDTVYTAEYYHFSVVESINKNRMTRTRIAEATTTTTKNKLKIAFIKARATHCNYFWR